jgi:hypothetical protein
MLAAACRGVDRPVVPPIEGHYSGALHMMTEGSGPPYAWGWEETVRVELDLAQGQRYRLRQAHLAHVRYGDLEFDHGSVREDEGDWEMQNGRVYLKPKWSTAGWVGPPDHLSLGIERVGLIVAEADAERVLGIRRSGTLHRGKRVEPIPWASPAFRARPAPMPEVSGAGR